MMKIATSGRAPFEVIIVRNVSRIGREMIEALANLKKLDEAGIRVWTYQDGKLIDMRDPVAVMMLLLQAFTADQQRVSVRKDVSDAMMRKARAGHVISTLPYGYRRVEKMDGDKRSHVARAIDKAEAAIVRRIFDETIHGAGKMAIAKGLIGDGVLTRHGGPWRSSTIAGILSNEVYRGEIISHRQCFKNYWGKRRVASERPAAEWIRVQSEADRIISDAVWYAVEARRTKNTATRMAAVAAGKPVGGPPPRDRESDYLLTGFARCGLCHGPICAIRRDVAASGLLATNKAPGSTRRSFYGCLNYHRNGRGVCANATTVLVDTVNAEILTQLRQLVGGSSLIDQVIKEIHRQRSAGATDATVKRLRAEIAKLERANERFVDSLGYSKQPLPSILAKIEKLAPELAALRRQLAASTVETEAPAVMVKFAKDEMKLWQAGVMKGDVADMRALFRKFLDGPIVLTPAAGVLCEQRHRNQRGPRRDTRAYAFVGRLSPLPLFSGFATSDPSRTASVTSWKLVFKGKAT
jgi:hypothetical protein